MAERILVCVAWPYASGPRHIGHVAGFGVPSDIFARYHRLKGNDVLMVSGTDDHGTPTMIAADREGVSAAALAERYNRLIAEDLQALGLTYDIFTRTETKNHYRVAQDLFRTLYERGFIVRGSMMGSFAAGTGRTLPDRYIEGTCPICGADGARGDQCDTCGNQLDPVDLIEPRSTIDGKPPDFRETEHFFLDLPAFADRLAEWIERQEHWRPNVRKFSLNFVKELKQRPITRDLDWGVPIPLPEYEGRDDKRMYVWFEAVIGYLSASIEWANTIGRPDAWREWWQNPDSRHFYFMGKDNIVFHTVIWTSILMGYLAGGEFGAGRGDLELPYDVVASEFLTMEGRKFSHSRGVVIYVNAGESEEEREEQERRRRSIESRNRAAWKRFVNRMLDGLSDREYVERVGPVVIVTNFVIFNHLLGLLVVRDIIDEDFGIEAQLELWDFMWGSVDKPGLVDE